MDNGQLEIRGKSFMLCSLNIFTSRTLFNVLIIFFFSIKRNKKRIGYVALPLPRMGKVDTSTIVMPKKL